MGDPFRETSRETSAYGLHEPGMEINRAIANVTDHTTLGFLTCEGSPINPDCRRAEQDILRLTWNIAALAKILDNVQRSRTV